MSAFSIEPSLSWRKTIHRQIVSWFQEAGRKLPWREQRSPYRTWISEIMAQQTRLQTVEPYFERFMQRFPTLADLARASQDEVLAAWSGLGYYSRARNLHRAARLIVERHGGEIPADVAAIRALPGIGPYTAGALASLAFGLPEPILDGNVIRVLARLLDLTEDVKRPDTRRWLWGVARKLVELGTPGPLNEGLMELGALVCVPSSPRCPVCPVQKSCAARQVGTEQERPVQSAKKPPVPMYLTAALVTSPAGKVLLLKNHEESGLFGGLWELPQLPGKTLPASDFSEALSQKLGARIAPGVPLGMVEHVLTHRRMFVTLVRCQAASARLRPITDGEHCWVCPAEELSHLGLSSLTRKLLALMS